MGTILDTIIEEKKKEVALLREQSFSYQEKRSHPSLAAALQQEEVTIIAEIKRASPSKGDLQLDVDVAAQAKQYEQCGASAISVLTDTTFFKGTFVDLQTVRETVALPVLCKDFMIDEVQIDKANKAGADVILLIVAALSDERLRTLYHYAYDLGLEVIVEVHDEEEVERAIALGATIIGVNNRNLKTFVVDIETTVRLAPRIIASGAVLISESGIRSREDVAYVVAHGARGILVGEALMKAKALQPLFQELRQCE